MERFLRVFLVPNILRNVHHSSVRFSDKCCRYVADHNHVVYTKHRG